MKYFNIFIFHGRFLLSFELGSLINIFTPLKLVTTTRNKEKNEKKKISTTTKTIKLNYLKFTHH